MNLCSIFSYVNIRPNPPFCGHTLLPRIIYWTNLNLLYLTSLYISTFLSVERKHIFKKKSINVHCFLTTFPLNKTLPSIWTNLNHRGPGLLRPKYILQDTLPKCEKLTTITTTTTDNWHTLIRKTRLSLSLKWAKNAQR